MTTRDDLQDVLRRKRARHVVEPMPKLKERTKDFEIKLLEIRGLMVPVKNVQALLLATSPYAMLSPWLGTH